MASRISVVIPSYNSAATIGRTLASLRTQTRPDLLTEVIVVDSSTDAATPAFLALQKAPVRVIRAGERVMPAIGRNLGAAEATGELLAFIDSDAYAAPDWLERLWGHASAGRRVGGGSISTPPTQRWSPVAWAQEFLQFNEFLDAGVARKKPFAPSCNLFCEAALFRETGGFPEIRASEDVLFGLKAGERAEFWFTPDARAFHIFREDFRAFLRNQRLLGQYALEWRRTKGRWKGRRMAFLAPAIAFVKGLRIAARVAASRPDLFPAFVFALPWFVAGLCAWGAGFASQASAPAAVPPPANHSTPVLTHV